MQKKKKKKIEMRNQSFLAQILETCLNFPQCHQELVHLWIAAQDYVLNEVCVCEREREREREGGRGREREGGRESEQQRDSETLRPRGEDHLGGWSGT